MAEATACFILRVPLEVLLRITESLPTPALCSFRVTCRSIEQSLYNTFTAEYFARKQFMISNFSLQALIDISKSRLGQHIRFLQIGTDHFKPSNPIGSFVPPLGLDIAQLDRLNEMVAEYTEMWATESFRDMLVEAFRNLSGLEDIIIRDCNSKRRSRDGRDAEWKSYGAATFFNETGVQLRQNEGLDWSRPGFPPNIPSKVFSAVLHALAESGAPARGIEVISRSHYRLLPTAFVLELHDEEALSPVLERLEKLHLCIEHFYHHNLGDAGDSNGTLPVPHEELEDFLFRTVNIKNLRINECHSKNGTFGSFLERLSRSLTDTEPSEDNEVSPTPILMPHLEELSIGIVNIEGPALLAFISTYAQSLKSLELWKVTLQRDLPNGETEYSEIQLWPSFFRKLSNVPGLELRHIKVGMLQQKWKSSYKPLRVSFKDAGAEAAYTGPDWRHFVGESVIPKLEVKWLQKVEEGEETLEEEQEDDDGDDEEALEFEAEIEADGEEASDLV